MPLAMTPDLAKSVLHASEGRYGGHTLERHVNISKAGLRRRSETGTPNGNVHLYTAFDSVHQCAEILSHLITHLGQSEDFFRVFYKQADGAPFKRERIALNRTYEVRMAGGRLETRFFTLWSNKKSDVLPIGLHIVSFFPSMPNMAVSRKDREAAKRDPYYPYA